MQIIDNKLTLRVNLNNLCTLLFLLSKLVYIEINVIKIKI